MLNENDFTMRLEAALALRKEREGREERSGMDHRKDKSSTKKDKKKNKQQARKDHRRKPVFVKQEEEKRVEVLEGDAVMWNTILINDKTSEAMDKEPPKINPSQCLFDGHTSSSLEASLVYMPK